MTIPLLDIQDADYEVIGRVQGLQWGEGAAALYAKRYALTRSRSRIKSLDALIALARDHITVLKDYDAGLYAEFCALSEASGLEPWQLVILNHYTDFRDIAPDAGGCSVVYAPLPTGPVIAQTWDMHQSAMEHVALMRVQPPDGPQALLFTLTGCFGMAGMNAAGVAVCINNLTPDDGRVGILWPALVRRMLREETADGALQVLMDAHLSSGHNYLVADRKAVFNVEATAVHKRITHEDFGQIYWHTNHYTHPELVGHQLPPPAASTTWDRYTQLDAKLGSGLGSSDELWELLSSHEGYPRSLCSHMAGDEPSASRTCGAILCDMESLQVKAVRGCLQDGDDCVVQVVA